MASKFTFITESEKQEIAVYRSPRALKIRDKRPTKIIIASNEEFDIIEFGKYIEYLKALYCAMSRDSKINSDDVGSSITSDILQQIDSDIDEILKE